MNIIFNGSNSHMKTYQQVVSFILLIGMLCFLTGFFWQSGISRLHTLYFILVVLPSLILIPLFIQEQLHKNKLFILIVIFFLYSLISVFWAENFQLQLFFKYIKRVAVLIILFYSVYHIVLHYPSSDKIIFTLLMFCGFGLATISLWGYFQKGLTGRLILWGGLNDVISSATVYGALFLLSAGAYLRERNKYILLLYLLLSFIFALEILLTKSRGPQLALLLSTPLLFLLITPVDYKRIFYPILFIILLVTGVFLFTDWVNIIFSRGFNVSARDIIWKDSVNLSLLKPWFGYGLGSDFKFFISSNRYVSHSHNFILSTWLYTGIFGVILILSIIFYALKTCCSHKKEYFAILGIIMIYGIFCLLSNGSYPISRANERWFVFWIPLAFIVANSLRYSEREGVQ